MNNKNINKVLNTIDIINNYNIIYIINLPNLSSDVNLKLRKYLFINKTKGFYIKNSLFKKVLLKVNKKKIYENCKNINGNIFIMVSKFMNYPAIVIIKILNYLNINLVELKLVYIYNHCYIGIDKLNLLLSFESKDRLIYDIVNNTYTLLINILENICNK